MSELEKKDVESDSSSDSESEKKPVTFDSDEDKTKNFAELRKKLQETEKERDDLKSQLEADAAKRTLDSKKEDDEEEDDEEDTQKTSKSDKSETQKLLFDKEMKRAVLNWNSKNKVSSKEWETIKSRVSLTGDEVDSEIEEKIDAAYHSLPSVRQRREKEIADKAKKDAMKQTRDDEMDIGGGGDSNLGSGEDGVRVNTKEKKWLDGFNVSPELRKGIDKGSDSHKDWKILDPQRKNR